MPNVLLVMVGGAIGAALRYGVGRLTVDRLAPGYPWGTMIVNLSGGFLAGLLLGWAVRHSAPEPLMLFLGVGLLGGFTTFSSFSGEVAQMIGRGELGTAAAYVGASVAGSVMLLFAGLWLARAAA